MIRGILILTVAGWLAAAAGLQAQAPAGGAGAAATRDKAADNGQKPAAGTQPANANPFPDDTSTVPVLAPSAAGVPAGSGSDTASTLPLPNDDADPVRSPDDPVPAATSANSGESSSLAGEDVLEPVPDSERPGKKNKKDADVEEPVHHESAAEDIQVGDYYLDTKNWKAALSRFQSAVVLDPENPEVYWGLAESERGLGKFAEARANYEKVVDYDPDSKHGKQARKALKDPALAAAQNAGAGQAAPVTPH